MVKEPRPYYFRFLRNEGSSFPHAKKCENIQIIVAPLFKGLGARNLAGLQKSTSPLHDVKIGGLNLRGAEILGVKNFFSPPPPSKFKNRKVAISTYIGKGPRPLSTRKILRKSDLRKSRNYRKCMVGDSRNITVCISQSTESCLILLHTPLK